MPNRDTALFVEACLLAIARSEHAGRRPARLTEPGLATWRRFKGHLGAGHLARLLIEDAAVVQPLPFDVARLDGVDLDLDDLDDAMASFLERLPTMDLAQSSDDYVRAQARALRLSSPPRSNLHRVKAHHRVIELPGSGGQIAHHLASTHDDVTLQDNLIVCTSNWHEDLLAGLIATDLGVPSTDHIVREPTLETVRETYRSDADFVMGFHPDRGGPFEEERLQTLFPNARIVLV